MRVLMARTSVSSASTRPTSQPRDLPAVEERPGATMPARHRHRFHQQLPQDRPVTQVLVRAVAPTDRSTARDRSATNRIRCCRSSAIISALNRRWYSRMEKPRPRLKARRSAALGANYYLRAAAGRTTRWWSSRATSPAARRAHRSAAPPLRIRAANGGRTESLRVIERFTRVDADTLRYEFTGRGPDAVDEPVVRRAAPAVDRRVAFRVRLPQGQPRHRQHAERRPGAGTAGCRDEGASR